MSVRLLGSTLSPATGQHTEAPVFFNLTNGEGPTAATVVPCLLLVICFIVGLPVNIAVMIDICRKHKRYAALVNPNILLLVLNLAVVDSVTLSTSPLAAYTLFWGYTMGDASCKTFFFIVSTCLFISVVTVTGISMTYFLSVRFAVANPRMLAGARRRRSALLLGGVWGGALLLSTSTLFSRQVENRSYRLRCIRKVRNDTEKVALLLMETLVGFVLPFLVLLTSYVCLYRSTAQKAVSATSAKQRKKLTQFVVSVVVVFLICWTPYHVINMVDVSTTLLRVSSPTAYDRLKAFRRPAGDSMKSLSFFNSVINPFLYAFTLRRRLNSSDASAKQKASNGTLDMSLA